MSFRAAYLRGPPADPVLGAGAVGRGAGEGAFTPLREGFAGATGRTTGAEGAVRAGAVDRTAGADLDGGFAVAGAGVRITGAAEREGDLAGGDTALGVTTGVGGSEGGRHGRGFFIELTRTGCIGDGRSK